MVSFVSLGRYSSRVAETGDHFTWTKVSTKVHNIIVGSLWVDQHGTMDITNHRTGEVCTMEYVPYAMFSPSDVSGCIVVPVVA